MRRKGIIGWVLFALALLFGFIGRAADADALYLLSGFCFLGALGVLISHLPFWARFRDSVPAMPGLFPRLGGRDWDPVTGQPSESVQRRRK